MSNAATNPAAPAATDHPPDAGHDAHGRDPHLAHHFDTPEQQYVSAKLGMWIFLGTEILMFGGLFCGYSVYRHNHPEVFAFAHQYLNKWLGAVNTLVLITSSLTMAWAVRSAQLGHQASLRWLMAITILGGYIFLGIKSVEYHAKWDEAIFMGPTNQFHDEYKGPAVIANEEKKARDEEAAKEHAHEIATGSHVEAVPAAEASARIDPVSLAPPDPNRGTSRAAFIHPTFNGKQGLAESVAKPKDEVQLSDLDKDDHAHVYTFFGIYFFMTGLHGLHVVIGMSLIAWVLLRSLGPKNVAWAVPLIPASIGVFLAVVGLIVQGHAGTRLIITGLIVAVLSVLWAMIWVPLRRNRSAASEFGPTYFTPVDLVGLYWHLVDLIWIFLFPLLYLIH